MPIEVETPDGGIAEFPDGTPDEVIAAALRKAFPPTAATTGSLALGQTEMKSNTLGERLTRELLSALPAVGGTLGAIAGTASSGPVGGVGGAGIGQMAGESARQMAAHAIYGTGPRTSTEAAQKITTQGVIGAGAEMAGLGIQGRGAPMLERAAQRYARVFDPSGRASKVRAMETGTEMAKRSMFPQTARGLEQSSIKEAAKAGAKVGQLEAQLTTPVAAKGLFHNLNQLKQSGLIKHTSVKGEEVFMKQMDENIGKLTDIVKEQGPNLNPQTLIDWKRKLDKMVADGFTKELADNSILAAKEETANILRRELASDFPDLAKANAEAHFRINIRNLMGDRKIRQFSAEPSKIGTYVAAATAVGTGAGGYLGGIGGAAGGGLAALIGVNATIQVVRLINAPAWQMTSGYIRSKLAKAIANQNSKEVIAITTRLLNAPKTEASPRKSPANEVKKQYGQETPSFSQEAPPVSAYPSIEYLFKSR